MVTLRRLGVLGGVVAVFCAGPLSAQSTPDSKLSIHGFFSQAYARTSEHQLLGIPVAGTLDYRDVALQFRYLVSDQDNFVMQIGQDHRGATSSGALQIDRVFYQRRFGSSTSVRVGRVLVPSGIYNEIRDVGTLLPFYMPPQSLYGDASYTGEALDGIVADQSLRLGSGWGLHADAYFGSWNLASNTKNELKVTNGLGTQLWLETPLSGVRVGLGAKRFDANIELGQAPDGTPITVDLTGATEWVASIDGAYDRFVLRAEHSQLRASIGDKSGSYVQAGINVTPKLSVTAQADVVGLSVQVPLPVPVTFKGEQDRDIGLSVRYMPTPNLTFRVEEHAFRGHSIEDQLLSPLGPPVSLRYFILSISTSF